MSRGGLREFASARGGCGGVSTGFRPRHPVLDKLAFEAILQAEANSLTHSTFLRIVSSAGWLKLQRQRLQSGKDLQCAAQYTPRNPQAAIDRTRQLLSAQHSMRALGMTSPCAQALICHIEDHLRARRAQKRHPAQVPLEARVVIALRMLRNGNVQDIARAFGVGATTVHQVAKEVLPCIADVTRSTMHQPPPPHERALLKAACGGALGDVAAVVDGLTVPVRPEKGAEEKYFSHHHKMCGVNYLLVCSPSGIPLAIEEIGIGGACETAAAEAVIGELIDRGQLSPEDVVLGDGLYRPGNTPIVGPDSRYRLNFLSRRATTRLSQCTSAEAAGPAAAALVATSAAVLASEVTTTLISGLRIVVENCVVAIKQFCPLFAGHSTRGPAGRGFVARDLSSGVVHQYMRAAAGLVAFRARFEASHQLRSYAWLAARASAFGPAKCLILTQRILGFHAGAAAQTERINAMPRGMAVRRERGHIRKAIQTVCDASDCVAPEGEEAPGQRLRRTMAAAQVVLLAKEANPDGPAGEVLDGGAAYVDKMFLTADKRGQKRCGSQRRCRQAERRPDPLPTQPAAKRSRAAGRAVWQGVKPGDIFSSVEEEVVRDVDGQDMNLWPLVMLEPDTDPEHPLGTWRMYFYKQDGSQLLDASQCHIYDTITPEERVWFERSYEPVGSLPSELASSMLSQESVESRSIKFCKQYPHLAGIRV